MPDRIQQQIGDLMGGGTFIASISLYSMEWFNLININDILTTISLVGGLFWLFYKVKNSIKTGKLKDIKTISWQLLICNEAMQSRF